MKYLFTMLVLLLPLPACAAPDPVDDSIPDHCRDYIKPSGVYEGHLVTTQNGVVIYDDRTLADIFQSGGPGTSWSNVVGTAKESSIIFAPPVRKFSEWTVALEGRATLTEATFDIIYTSDDEVIGFHYEFTNLRRTTSEEMMLGISLNLWGHSYELLEQR